MPDPLVRNGNAERPRPRTHEGSDVLQPKHPGVYLFEATSNVKTIAVSPHIDHGLRGRAKRGKVNEPVSCFKFGEFNRRFGGLWVDGPLSYSVDDFFANGGGQAVVVRLFKPNSASDSGVATITAGSLELMAATWRMGNKLKATVSYTNDANAAASVAAKYGVTAADLFDLTIQDKGTNAEEKFRNLSVHANAGARRVDRVLAAESNLVSIKLDNNGDPVLPAARPSDGATGQGQDGNDGQLLTPTDVIGAEDQKTGIYALLKNRHLQPAGYPARNARRNDRFHRVGKGCGFLRAAPRLSARRSTRLQRQRTGLGREPGHRRPGCSGGTDQFAAHLAHQCLARSAVLSTDPPTRPLRDGQMDTFVPSGAIAGVMARTDNNRGVWKAPPASNPRFQGRTNSR